MRRVRGIGIIVASGANMARLGTALTLACANLALGGRARLLLDGDAVRLAAHADPLLDTCFELGGSILLCQTGLAAVGLAAENLDPRFGYGGMVAWLSELDQDRLVTV